MGRACVSSPVSIAQVSVRLTLYPSQVISRFLPVCASESEGNARSLRLRWLAGLLATWPSHPTGRNTAARPAAASAHWLCPSVRQAHRGALEIAADGLHPHQSAGPRPCAGFLLSASDSSPRGGCSAQTSRG